MILSKVFALLIGKISKDFKSAQVTREVARGYHWI